MAQNVVPSTTEKKEGSGSWVEGPWGVETFLVHGGQNPDPTTGSILTPVAQSTTFVQESIDKYLAKGFSYSRSGNPTVAALEERASKIEGGAGAAFFSTGMAATVTVMSAFLSAGDHCVITDCSYGGTNRVARKMFSNWGIEYTFVDFTDLNKVKKAIKKNTTLIFSESPANPVCTLTDLEGVSKLAKEAGAIHVCDTTFATPVICRGLDHGVDLVLQSTTKFYDGHNATVGGCVISKTAELAEKIKFFQNMHGNIMAPWTAFIQLTTVKTMALRVRKQSETAQAVAEFLQGHPKVDKVCYPGLDSHPQRAIAKKQHRDGLNGGMLWFEVKGGTAAGRKLMDTAQRPWSLCENLGATESIITAPAVMTHANMEKADREKVGITDGFIRISCGIEDADDLIRSLKKALDNL